MFVKSVGHTLDRCDAMFGTHNTANSIVSCLLNHCFNDATVNNKSDD